MPPQSRATQQACSPGREAVPGRAQWRVPPGIRSSASARAPLMVLVTSGSESWARETGSRGALYVDIKKMAFAKAARCGKHLTSQVIARSKSGLIQAQSGRRDETGRDGRQQDRIH